MAPRPRLERTARVGRGCDGGGERSAAAVDVVDHAECSGRSCRSCAAVAVADCVALGCCPCAVVSLLGLALVRAPVAAGRRCIGRLRRKRALLLHKKRVRDVAEGKNACPDDAAGSSDGAGDEDEEEEEEEDADAARPEEPVLDAEKMWLEMYQVGRWGFGRVSFSGNT